MSFWLKILGLILRKSLRHNHKKTKKEEVEEEGDSEEGQIMNGVLIGDARRNGGGHFFMHQSF